VERFPLILGDEGSVTLVKVGENLRQRYQVGQRYAVQPSVEHPPINHRERYRDNAQGVQKLGVGYTLPGHLAEYMLVPEEVIAAGCLLPLPDPALPYAHAAIAEPFSCAISGQDHHMHLIQEDPLGPREALKGLRPGGVVVVIGAGAMGRMHVDAAFSYRPQAIVVSDLLDERLDLVEALFTERARALGVELYVNNPKRDDLQASLDDLTDYNNADDVIVAVGSRRAIEIAQGYVGRHGVLNLFGGLKKGEDIVDLNSTIVHYKEINVTGSSGGSPWDVARTLDLMASGEIDAGVHIAQIGDLDHAAEFLRRVEAQEIDGKAVVYPHRRTGEILVVSSWTAADERAYLEQGENG
jgi:threonine dehydrogenase-like Zn-dependent dehydrogenase